MWRQEQGLCCCVLSSYPHVLQSKFPTNEWVTGHHIGTTEAVLWTELQCSPTPRQFICWSPMIRFKRGHEGEALNIGLVPYKEKHQRDDSPLIPPPSLFSLSLSPLLHHVGTQREGSHLKARNQVPPNLWCRFSYLHLKTYLLVRKLQKNKVRKINTVLNQH